MEELAARAALYGVGGHTDIGFFWVFTLLWLTGDEAGDVLRVVRSEEESALQGLR